MMTKNKLREILRQGACSRATRLISAEPIFTEAVGVSGNFDYVEFAGEYAPFSQADLENLARAGELYDMSMMIKVDFQNRAYVAQRAVAAGFQAINFADHHCAEEVRETVRLMRPDTPEDGGRFGFPNRRYTGCRVRIPQMEHAQRLRDVVLLFMIEKKEALEDLEAICSVPGVDMVQFGPSDYSMSCGFNRKDHMEECREAERYMIQVALKHGVRPRCEIASLDSLESYMDLGVRDFCLGDQYVRWSSFLENEGASLSRALREAKL
ncbi:MAG: aldolase/citrate lyase family protein [Eubacteriales bacterium]|nr:aldolase/citrate lyase family protein [Eubacteriales bacterium]